MKDKIVLVPFPFSDAAGAKPRPALCLTEPLGVHRQIVVAFITSQPPVEPLPSDVALDAAAPDFAQTGLRVSSTLRLNRLTTINRSLVRRDLGTLPDPLQAEVAERLRTLFGLS